MLAKVPRLFDIPELKKMADEATARAEHFGPLDAEISGAADWYLIQTFAGDDLKAFRWLARRRFGVFRPMQQRRLRHSNVAVQGWEPVFPGWIFVYCWDIKRMMKRIRSCPGVFEILCYPNTSTPVPVDRIDEEGVSFIDKLRALSWAYNDKAPRAGHATVRAERSIRRNRCKMDKRSRRELHRLKKVVKSKGVWDESSWEDANRLEPHERITLLKRTLNLPL